MPELSTASLRTGVVGSPSTTGGAGPGGAYQEVRRTSQRQQGRLEIGSSGEGNVSRRRLGGGQRAQTDD
jgi:hypothetical protein